MNRELQMVFVPGICWILFALGGTQISDKVKGWKGWRRFILPAVIAAAVFLAGFSWQQAVLCGIIAAIAFSLPYGDRTPWTVKPLIGLAFACISLPIGVSEWNTYTAVGFIVLFILSNTPATAQTWTWKICEGFFGLLVGIQVAFQTMHH